MSSQTLDDPASSARREAGIAGRRAGVEVRQLTTSAEFVDGSALLARVWGTSVEASPLASDLLTSLSHSGAGVIGAFVDGRPAGVGVAIAGAPGSTGTYGLIAGVASQYAGRGIGYAIKQAQRAWALDRGATEMIWTFDPLIRRNAHFNLVRLGAAVVEYRPDFYPPMHDELNRHDRTDRLVVRWDLVNPRTGGPAADIGPAILEPGADSEPVRHAGHTDDAVRVWIPADIEADRRADQQRSGRWRTAQRGALLELAAAGYTPTSVTADGYYLLQRTESR